MANGSYRLFSQLNHARRTDDAASTTLKLAAHRFLLFGKLRQSSSEFISSFKNEHECNWRFVDNLELHVFGLVTEEV
jgi:hypothetical protein